MNSFGKQLSWFLWDGPALPLMAEQEGTWRAGLCSCLAEGILRWITFSRTLPPHAVFLMVVGDADCPAHHVVVCILLEDEADEGTYRYFLDANGVSTEEGLLSYWRDKEGLDEPFLAAFDEPLLLNLGIAGDARLSTRLAECFRETFGTFSPVWLEESTPSSMIVRAGDRS